MIDEQGGIRPHIRFGTVVTSAQYRDGRWWVATAAGEEAFDILITATGVLRVPRYPDIPGLDPFPGTMFHSSRWDHSVSLPDKRIGLIGTGSTGVQITAELGGKVNELKIFQRTPQWVVPMPNLRYSRLTRAAMQRWPVLDRIGYRFWRSRTAPQAHSRLPGDVQAPGHGGALLPVGAEAGRPSGH